MENELRNILYEMPNVGCMVGTAYQRMLSGLENALADAGINLTVTEYLLLRALYTRDGQQQCDLATMTSKDKAAISRTVTALERKGLVRCVTESHKCRRVFLTEQGQRLRDRLLDIALRREQQLLSLAPTPDIEAFLRVLKAIIHN